MLMKLTRLLIVGSSPQFKCGAAVAGAGLTAVSSLMGSAANAEAIRQQNALAKRNVDAQLSAQREENALNRDWQTAEAEKARQFNTSERVSSQEHQVQMLGMEQQNAKEMAGINAQYNSPVYQSQELLKAGINPQVYFGGSSSFGGSSQASPSAPSVPSSHPSPMVGSVSGLSPVGFQPADLRIPNLLSSIADLAKAGVDIDKAPAEIRNFLSSALKSESDARLADVQKQKEDLLVQFERSTLPARVKNAFYEAAKNYQHAQLLYQQGKTEEAKRLELSSQSELNKSLSKLHGAKAFEAEFYNQHLNEIYEHERQLRSSEIEKNKAQANEANSVAENQHAQALTENDLRELKKTAQTLSNGLEAQKYQFNDSTAQDQIESLRKQLRALDDQHKLDRIKAVDEEAYNTLQRLIRGHGVAGDAKRALKVILGMDDRLFVPPIK